MKTKSILLFSALLMLASACMPEKKSPNVTDMENPLDVVRLIGDKLIRDTPFKYRLKLSRPGDQFSSMKTIDFTRTFGTGKQGLAYAFTQLIAPEKMEQKIELEHSDGCRIWLNDKLIYDLPGKREAKLRKEERSINMSFEVMLNLNEGTNNLLIESTSAGRQWIVAIQPPSLKGAVNAQKKQSPSISIANIPGVGKEIAEISNWLVLGLFDKSMDDSGLSSILKGEIVFGEMYKGTEGQLVTWTIPKIEVLGDVIDAKEWGTNYNWNYHNGGVAWAMQLLSEASGEKKYDLYATNFCDFHLKGKDFIDYQVNTLHEFNSANSLFLKTPLLDFTLAPSIPFIYRLRKEKQFDNREKYVSFIDSMIH